LSPKPEPYHILNDLHVQIVQGFEFDAVTGDARFPEFRPIGSGQVFLVLKTD